MRTDLIQPHSFFRALHRAASLVPPLLFALLLAECGLRFIGYRPTKDVQTAEPQGLYERDANAGWRNRAGVHSLLLPEGKTTFTTWSGGRRATRNNDTDYLAAQRTVILLGDSFVQGGGLNDEDTFGWNLQALVPELRVENYGTGGYGTCQSLLRLRDYIAPTGQCHGTTFVYGFSPFHEARNIAHPLFVWRLAHVTQSRSILMPVCSLDHSGALLISPPETFSSPYRVADHSAVAMLVTESYYAIKGAIRGRSQRAVTEEILLTMQREVESCGGEFAVLLMRIDGEPKEHYSSFLASHGIAFVDGSHPEQDLPGMQLSDGHPNAEVHRMWAERLRAFLNRSES